MSKPFATFVVAGPYGGEERVHIARSKARRCVAQFYAPMWRAMAFTSVEAAKSKAQRHPAFIRWEA